MFRRYWCPGYTTLKPAICPCPCVSGWEIIAVPNDGDRGELYAELERACDELDKTLDTDEINKTPWEYPSLRPVVDLDYLVELLKRARQLKRAKMEIERRLGKRLVPLS